MEVIYDTHSVRTNPGATLAGTSGQSEPWGRCTPSRGAAEQAKVPTPSSGGFGLREGPKSYPAMFRAILDINLLLWL